MSYRTYSISCDAKVLCEIPPLVSILCFIFHQTPASKICSNHRGKKVTVKCITVHELQCCNLHKQVQYGKLKAKLMLRGRLHLRIFLSNTVLVMSFEVWKEKNLTYITKSLLLIIPHAIIFVVIT